MIVLATEEGRPVRWLGDADRVDYGWHQNFGFVSVGAAEQRERLRQKRGHPARNATAPEFWRCRFRMEGGAPQALDGCEVVQRGAGWDLTTPLGRYQLLPAKAVAAIKVADAVPASEDRRFFGPLVLGLVAAALALSMAPTGKQEINKAERLQKLVEKQKTIYLQQVKIVKPAKKKRVAAKVKRKKNTRGAAVKQKLGFLALLGKKDLKKAVGGMPTQAKRRSAGAGYGGDKGSGGELLQGLGKGLKHTTVGNTGVAGLGGIGNAGAGGGLGGYGSSYVGSGGGGGGAVLSNVDLSEAVELAGGLDRAVIQATIAKYLNQVRRCYEKGLRQHRDLTGQVLMDFEIAASGRLNFANVKRSSLGHKGVEGCISRAMMTWIFPKPVGGTLVRVKYPFMLKPASFAGE